MYERQLLVTGYGVIVCVFMYVYLVASPSLVLNALKLFEQEGEASRRSGHAHLQ